MTTENWIALAAVLITTFGGLCVAVYNLIKLMIKSSLDDAEIKRLEEDIKRRDDKIESLREQIRDMN